VSALTPFAFEDHLVRIVTQDGEPWFVANDVCRALGLVNPRKAVGALDVDEKGVTIGDTLGGAQEMTVISEAGTYRLVFTSRKPEAEKFKRWLAHEVLPAIRRTGRWDAIDGAGEAPEERSDHEKRFALDQVTEARITFGPRAVGLPWVAEMEEVGQPLGFDAADPVARFARDGVERVPGVVTPAAMLWPAFQAFCRDHALTPPTQESFQARFGRMGFPKRKVGGRMHYLDLRAKAREVAEGGREDHAAFCPLSDRWDRRTRIERRYRWRRHGSWNRSTEPIAATIPRSGGRPPSQTISIPPVHKTVSPTAAVGAFIKSGPITQGE
jgi:prophage antirepressor-like protein